MPRPKVCILRTAGTNCDKETAFAFGAAGGEAELVHINSIIAKDKRIENYQILAVPGGFSYGDDLGAGKILANELRYALSEEIRKFIRDGKLIIGICNGFQILVKAGLLPGNPEFRQEASLILNDSAKFEDRWVHLRAPEHQSTRAPVKCIWTKNLPAVISLPVAHGEGKFITENKPILEKLKKNGQIVFRYCGQDGKPSGYPDNPNGSIDDIAGICDETRRILGLIPNPERHIDFLQHPQWKKRGAEKKGDGFKIFKNGIDYARKNI